MEQGSQAWLEWRKKGVGSSDAPIIMGVSPYKTKHQLWCEKIQDGCADESKGKNFIFEKGHHIEERVRGYFELKEDITYTADLFEREDKPYIRASMDLANKEHGKGKEVKYVSLEEFEAGICPERYFPQVQHQYLCTDFLEINLVLVTDYVMVNGEKVKIPKGSQLRMKEIAVPVDVDYCAKLYDECVKFMEYHVEKKIAPELTDRDAVVIKDRNLKHLLSKYKRLKAKVDKVKPFQDEMEEIKEEIFKLTTHPIMKYGEIRVTTSERKGSIDYKKIPAVKAMKEDELESFRGKSSVTRSIKC